MNTFGNIFRISIFGESHGPCLGIVIDGVRPGLEISVEDFAEDLARRRSGAPGTTPRREEDLPEIVSGVLDGHATGAPLTILFANKNQKSSDYDVFASVPRPGHADYTATLKYKGFNDLRGSGHFSGRLTLPLVAAGVVAKKQVRECSIKAEIVSLGGLSREKAVSRAGSGNLTDSELWLPELKKAASEGDSLGAVVECRIENVPAGLGEPFFDSVESVISHAVFAIPGVRGIEFGDGFRASSLRGSEHNDCFGPEPLTNHSGGVNGGITNGAPIVFRVAFKPTSSIAAAQRTYDFQSSGMTTLKVGGRHDVCFALRAPVAVEAAAAVALAGLVAVAK